MGSLKILRLPDSAFRLWVKGLCYCQTHLTDGLIPREWLRETRAKRADVEMLTHQLVDGKAPLWEHIEAFGFKVHDYLDWNDSRERVLQRQAAAGAERDATRHRLANWRANHKMKRECNAVTSPAPVTPVVTPDETPMKRACNALTKPNLTKEDLSTADKPPTATEDQVKAFYQWFAAEYKIQRHSDYLVHFKRDAPVIWKLLQTVPMERLKLLATLMLTEKIADDWIQQSDRGITILKVKLNWLNERLSAWELQRANGTQG